MICAQVRRLKNLDLGCNLLKVKDREGQGAERLLVISSASSLAVRIQDHLSYIYATIGSEV